MLSSLCLIEKKTFPIAAIVASAAPLAQSTCAQFAALANCVADILHLYGYELVGWIPCGPVTSGRSGTAVVVGRGVSTASNDALRMAFS